MGPATSCSIGRVGGTVRGVRIKKLLSFIILVIFLLSKWNICSKPVFFLEEGKEPDGAGLFVYHTADVDDGRADPAFGFASRCSEGAFSR